MDHIIFSPKDNTPGFTIKTCNFRDNRSSMTAIINQILGINTDDEESHVRFVKKQQLLFPLLIDKQGEVSKLYEALFKLDSIKLCTRHSFILVLQGILAKIYRKITPSQHIQQVLYV